ncbi:MAG: xylanase, partial [Bacteroidota bacterium]|nr:xylanase [Bacteroidota bacterium]
VEKIAKANNVTIIDLYHSMKNQAENFPDGIHPNEAGAKVMAEMIARKLLR